MSKNSYQSPVTSKNPSSPAERSTLAEELYQLGVRAAGGVRRFRTAIVVVICLVALAILAAWAWGQYRISRTRAIAADLHRLTTSRTPDEPPDAEKALPELERLVQNARGSEEERWVLRNAVTFLIDSAREKLYPKPRPGSSAVPGLDLEDDVAPPAPAPETARLLLSKADELLQAAGSRFEAAKDAEMLAWSASANKALDSLVAASQKEAVSRPQKPVLPPAPAIEGPPVPAPAPSPAPAPTPASPSETPKADSGSTPGAPSSGEDASAADKK